MSATPEARGEYSRGSEHSGGPSRPAGLLPRGAGELVLGGAAVGALLLVVAELTPLYRVRTVPDASLLRSVLTGSNHAFALIPIALLAVFLGVAFRRTASRVALLSLGAAGALALAVALAIDLPDARRHNHAARVGSGRAAHLVLADASPTVGLYLETLGAIVLIATCGSGLLLVGIRPAR